MRFALFLSLCLAQLTGASLALTSPTNQPAGRIAFIRNGSLWICDGDGTNPRRLVSADRRLRERFYYPAWLPGGRHITFTRSHGSQHLPARELIGVHRVWIVDVENRTLRPLLPSIGRMSIDNWQQYICWGRTAWHPSGREASVVWPGFYDDNDLIPNFENTLRLKIFDRNRKRWKEIDSGYTPSWSPYGKKLVYAGWPYSDQTVEEQERYSPSHRPFGIFVATAPRYTPRQKTYRAGDSNPVFSWDGKMIYFLRLNRTCRLPAKGGRVEALGLLKDLRIHRDWTRTPRGKNGTESLLGSEPPDAAWSPDRRFVAFISPDDAKEDNSRVGSLYVADIYGKHVKRICRDAESPAWSLK